MKKIIPLFTIFLMFVSGPITSFAATDASENQIMVDSNHTDSATFEIDGITYSLTLKVDGDFQKAIIDDGTKKETVSYDSSADELRFNGKLVSDEELESMKSIVDEGIVRDDIIKTDDGKRTQVMVTKIPYKLVKTHKGSINVTVATVLVVTGLILLIPTGTGAIAGVVLSARAIAILASAIVSSMQCSCFKVVYFKFQTYYKNAGGYWWNKFVLSVYKDSKRTKLIKSVSTETKYGKKYSFDNLGKGNSFIKRSLRLPSIA